MYPIITVDGPSGAGKGTLCASLSNLLNFHVLDSGALYRILGLFAHNANLLAEDPPDEQSLADLAQMLDIFFDFEPDGAQLILVNGENVTDSIRTETVGGYASVVAQFPAVREALFELQKSFAKDPGLVADGRDMGTVIFPDATLKIFLTASAQKRAQRRVKQLQDMNKSANIAPILAEIEARDLRDKQRKSSPLKPADDAMVIDSSDMTAEQVLDKVLAYCIEKGLYQG